MSYIGCGSGTWLRRLVTRAKALGFIGIAARGFDVAEAQVQAARLMAHDISRTPDVDLTFDIADLSDPLSEAATCAYSRNPPFMERPIDLLLAGSHQYFEKSATGDAAKNAARNSYDDLPRY
jgi:hypothetical protein